MTSTDFFKSISNSFQFNSYQELVEKLYITAIVDSFQRIQKVSGIKKQKENEIRNHLVFDLENNNILLQPFLQTKILKFTKENTILLSATETKRTDIEFIISVFGDFVVECKNLSSVEQRYVDDGLIRFTEEYYSKSDLDASMIGFIVAGNIAKIIDGLKLRVVQHNSTTNCQRLLNQLCINYQYSFHSEHNRKIQRPIIIHHLFVTLV
jgi:hypothetical protein